MNEAVVDTSVILALLKNESIDERAYAVVDGAVMSAVNVAEIYTKLSDLKMLSAHDVDRLLATLDRIEPLSVSQARLAGFLRDKTRHVGLSLGDRCCLALALELEANVYTTERAWMKVDVGLQVELLR